MTRKHFEAIAEAISTERMWTSDPAKREAIESVAFGLAATFTQFNSNFDKGRFIEACGF